MPGGKDGPPWPVGTSPMSTLHWLENVQALPTLTFDQARCSGRTVAGDTPEPPTLPRKVHWGTAFHVLSLCSVWTLMRSQVPRNMTSGSQKDFGTHVGAHTGPSQVGGQMGPSQMDFVSQKGFGSQVGGGHTGPSSQVGGGQMDFGSHMGPSSQVGGGHMDFGSQKGFGSQVGGGHMDFGSQKGFGSQVVGGQMGPGSHMNFDSQVSGGGGQSHAPTNPMGPSSQMHGHSGQMHPSQIQGRSQIGQMRTGSQISNPGAGGPCGPPRPGSQSGQAGNAQFPLVKGTTLATLTKLLVGHCAYHWDIQGILTDCWLGLYLIVIICGSARQTSPLKPLHRLVCGTTGLGCDSAQNPQNR